MVRTTAAEIRKKFAQYYQEPGHENEIRVMLPQGPYLPEFRLAPAVPPAPVRPEASAPAAPSVMRQRSLGMAIALAVVAAVGLGAYLYSRVLTELNLFWRPLLEDGSSAVICVGQPLRIYMFEGHRSAELNEKMVGTLTTSPASPEVRQNTPLTLSELRPAGERYYSSATTWRRSGWRSFWGITASRSR